MVDGHFESSLGDLWVITALRKLKFVVLVENKAIKFTDISSFEVSLLEHFCSIFGLMAPDFVLDDVAFMVHFLPIFLQLIFKSLHVSNIWYNFIFICDFRQDLLLVGSLLTCIFNFDVSDYLLTVLIY